MTKTGNLSLPVPSLARQTVLVHGFTVKTAVRGSAVNAGTPRCELAAIIEPFEFRSSRVGDGDDAVVGLGRPGGTLLATSLGDLAAGFFEEASARLREHPALLRLLNLAPGPRAGGHLDLPAGDEELPETADPITECDGVRSYGRS
jgi:hypothetical protein